MTLRRCDSLPARLREVPAPPNDKKGGDGPVLPDNKISESKTIPNFQDTTPAREEVIAAWKSLHTDVKNIKNGFSTNVTINSNENERYNTKSFVHNNKEHRKRITYANCDVELNSREADRCSSFPLDQAQTAQSVSAARRRTLLQRLLSWRTRECNCREQYRPKPRAEDLLCTCGTSIVNQASKTDKCIKFTERGRSKSVGYETAREITQFRRLVKCDSKRNL